MSLNCWLIFDITLSLHQAPNYHHKHPPSLFPSPPHSFRSSSHAPWSTVLGHRLCPSWSLSVTVPSWDDPWPYSPHFPTCQPNLQPLCSPSLLGQPQPQGSPIPTPLNGRAPQAHFPLASTFHTPAWMPWSPVPHQGGASPTQWTSRGNLVLGASVGSRVWWTCFLLDLWPLASPPHQHQLPPKINTAPATWGCCGVPDTNHMQAGLVALPAGDSLVTAAWSCNCLCQGLLGAKVPPTCIL